MTIRQIADFPGINSAPVAEPVGNDGRGVCAFRAQIISHGTSVNGFYVPCGCSVCDDLRFKLEIAAENPSATENKNPLGGRNRDKTGLRTVKKGVYVDYSGLTFVVDRVRLGVAYGRSVWQEHYFFAPCRAVLVRDSVRFFK